MVQGNTKQSFVVNPKTGGKMSQNTEDLEKSNLWKEKKSQEMLNTHVHKATEWVERQTMTGCKNISIDFAWIIHMWSVLGFQEKITTTWVCYK